MPEPLFKTLQRFLEVTNQDLLLTNINYIRELGPQLEALGKLFGHIKPFASSILSKEGVIPFGQLQTKVEAAGKIRVFAMVDY
jgi:hypothetical protein